MKLSRKRWLLSALICMGITTTASAQLPEMTTDTNNPHWYLIKNMRTDGSNRGNRGTGYTYAYTDGEASSNLKLAIPSELELDNGEYLRGALWYFVSAGDEDANGYVPVRIYNALTGKYLKNHSNQWTTADNEGIWYLKSNTRNVTWQNTTYTYEGYNILSAKNVTNNVGWNNSGNQGLTIGSWKGNDEGSIWGFEVPNAERLDATMQRHFDYQVTWPNLNGATISKEVTVREGLSLWSAINQFNGSFTISNYTAETAPIASANGSITLEGEWAYWIQVPMETPLRMRLRAAVGVNEAKYMRYDHTENQNSTINIRYSGDGNVIEPERIWYFKNAGFDTDLGVQKVTLHNLAAPNSTGVVIGTGSGSKAKFDTDNITIFTLSENTHPNNNANVRGFGLRVGTSGNAYINEYQGANNGWFSVWNPNNSDAKNDNGGILKYYALTEADVEAMVNTREVPGFGTITYDSAKKAAAKANPTLANLRAMVDDYTQVLTGDYYRIVYTRGPKVITLAGFADTDADSKDKPLGDDNPNRVLHQATENSADVNQIWKAVMSSTSGQIQFQSPNGHNYHMGTPQGSATYVTKDAPWGVKLGAEYWRSKGVWVLKVDNGSSCLNHNRNHDDQVISFSAGDYFKDGGNRIDLKKVTTVDFTIPEGSQLSTICYPFAVKRPSGTQVLIVTGVNNGTLEMSNFRGAVLPAKTPFVIKSTHSNLVFEITDYTPTAAEQAQLANNILTGTLVQRKPYDANTHFVVSADGSKFELVTEANGVAAANTAIIEVSKLPESEQSATELTFPDLTYTNEIAELKAQATAVISLGVLSDEAIEAWNADVEAVGNNVEFDDYAQLEESYTALCQSYKEVSLKAAYHGNTNDYLGVYNNAPRRCGNESNGNRAWTIKPVAEGGFKMFNNWKNQYLQHSATQDPRFVDEADASVYRMEVFDAENKVVGFYIDELDIDKKFVNDHTNVIVAGPSSDDSKWVITLYSADSTEPAREYYNGAKATVFAEYTLGDGVGQYQKSDEYLAIEPTLDAAEAADATSEQLFAAADALRSATNLRGEFNLPHTGLYRIKNDANNRYMSSNIYMDGTEARLEMLTTNGANTVWYYDEDTKLLAAFDNGLCFGSFNSATKANNQWATVLSTANNHGEVTFAACGAIGKYSMCTQGNRRIYGNTTRSNTRIVDAGGDDGVGYRWTLETVEYLPIPGTNSMYTTVYSPVALQLKNGMIAYTAQIENGSFKLNKVEGNIPANTPVIIYTDHGYDAGRGDGSQIYLKVVDDAEAITDNDLQGRYYAQAAGENELVYNHGKFVPATEQINGFTAYLTAEKELNIKHAISEQLVPGKVYAIKNTDNRGYLVYNPNQEAIWTSGKGNYDTNADTNAQTEARYHWTIVKDEAGNSYLYNLGAQKYAASYLKKSGSSTASIEFAWNFSNYPTAVNIQPLEWQPGETLETTTFNILGGQNTLTTTRPIGMMIINGDNTPVEGLCGNSVQDGNGFRFIEIAYETAPVVPTAAEVEAVKEEMIQGYETAVVAASIDYEGISVEAGNHIGYYKNISQFVPAFAAVEEGADAEAKHYAVVRALNAMDNTDIHGFEHEKAYRFDADGEDVYYKASINPETGVVSVITGTLDVNGLFGKDDNAMYWLATENGDGTLSFSHTFEIPKPKAGTETEEPAAAPMRRAAAQEMVTVTCHLAENVTPRYDGFGKASLVNNKGTAVLKTTVYAPSGDAREMTTGIKEVELATPSLRDSDTIYDLQGRRVVKPGHGLYIVNGKKVRL